LTERLQPPAFVEGGDQTHLLGTDPFGRDVLSRLLHGGRISLIVVLAVLFLGGGLGSLLGLASGFLGGWVDAVLMRINDAMMSLPILLLAILFALTLGPGLSTVVMAVSLLIWTRFARIIRGEALSLKEKEFVAAGYTVGCSRSRILFKYLLPNTLNTIVVLMTLQAGWVIIAEASLSFLGAGIPAPQPSWGQMIAEGRAYTTSAWWVPVFPGLAITLVVLSFNLAGNWLRDKLDPKLRQLV
jgi:peptide/nickel transport system permease protein